jgi:hypothetical protein
MEMSRKELLPQDVNGFEKLESFKVIHLLRQDATSYTGICNIRLRSEVSLNDLIGVAGFAKVQLLSKESDGSLTVFIEGRPRSGWHRPGHRAEGYSYPPFELEGDKWRMTFLGSEGQVRKILASLDRRGLHYRIIHSGDARFEPVSPLSALSPRQRETIMAAYRKGYYDFPRRIKSEELATSLGIAKSTLAQHLRKAEKGILDVLSSTKTTASK